MHFGWWNAFGFPVSGWDVWIWIFFLNLAGETKGALDQKSGRRYSRATSNSKPTSNYSSAKPHAAFVTGSVSFWYLNFIADILKIGFDTPFSSIAKWRCDLEFNDIFECSVFLMLPQVWNMELAIVVVYLSWYFLQFFSFSTLEVSPNLCITPIIVLSSDVFIITLHLIRSHPLLMHTIHGHILLFWHHSLSMYTLFLVRKKETVIWNSIWIWKIWITDPLDIMRTWLVWRESNPMVAWCGSKKLRSLDQVFD